MPSSLTVVWVTYLTRASSAIILAILLFTFHKRHQRSYLRHWTRSWIALSIYYLSAASSLWLMTRYQAAHASRLVISNVMAASGYLAVGWLLFGAAELLQRRHVRIRVVNITLPALAAFGLVVTLVSASPGVSPDLRVLARVGLYGLLTGIAFLVAAWSSWRASKRRESRFGVSLLASAFALYGLVQLDYFVSTVQALTGSAHGYVEYLGFGDFIFLMLMGLGMVTSLLEDEREAANLALTEVEHLAYHDPLTGLPNRPLFMDRLIVALAHARRNGKSVAVFFIDLDRFKEINDTLGHSAGDVLLKEVSRRLMPLVRGQDTLARFGSDVFALLIQDLEEVEHAARLASRLLAVIREPYVINSLELFASSSIGISIFPNDGDDPETLVRNADTAMNRAKEQGRDSYSIYAPEMNARAFERLATENMLHHAISHDELVLHYQPLVDLDTRAVFGVEALVRWNHPEKGLLLPAEFIHIAEQSGQIVAIGEWVLRTACETLKCLQSDGDANFLMSINLSARQFQQTGLAETVQSAVRAADIVPSSIQVEITESAAMMDPKMTIATLEHLRHVGVSVSVDDFGTGYSSLEYLKRFPIDALKLDQTFVRDLSDDSSDLAIATAVVAMAHGLGLKVVAEGVEKNEQFEHLRRIGCDRIQGHLFSAALPFEELQAYLARNHHTAEFASTTSLDG